MGDILQDIYWKDIFLYEWEDWKYNYAFKEEFVTTSVKRWFYATLESKQINDIVLWDKYEKIIQDVLDNQKHRLIDIAEWPNYVKWYD